MKFLVDAQLPPSLARRLRAKGHEASHVEDVGLNEADDETIKADAARSAAVLVTKDRDFLAANDDANDVVQILWIRTGNVSNRELLRRFSAAWMEITEHLESGASIVELR